MQSYAIPVDVTRGDNRIFFRKATDKLALRNQFVFNIRVFPNDKKQPLTGGSPVTAQLIMRALRDD
ncbi:hypothetical protein BOW39_05010 [Solemya velum gill symbiont]|uniref:hypothetical protein n=1 Tax=Solemya velum gill symbiont TaxID=2340 RepID=UPI000996E8A2|nr:hypothetical protein [Solemya velum gill symbiont]OOZ47340.1 hypothetical protein BOW38_03250 [Solemya velum gill symbiont]OOZ49755.1 hypothetical protein BOW39_05010 [Solemya velum gill symbiont]OOZ52442.1 hypothetical protein BOW40_02575 [Solemya velum gill symbiont]OOZ55351.1 hypothetical protein BOW41_03305 [Solemya velum gill symbiont]OOZ56959.1 hypothetical protein BOW42_04955 [Solemya velum gill symbiont]